MPVSSEKWRKRKDYDKKMNERLKIILTGLGIIILAIIGLWEYMQMFLYFDLPQVIVIMPVVGAAAAILFRKYCFLVVLATTAVSIVYQMVEKGQNSKIAIILNILPIILLFMLAGIAGGFLIRVLCNGNRPNVVGIICCVLGVVLTFGGSVAMFGNPLYPFKARFDINHYAQKYGSENYPISKISVYYSVEDLEYQGKVEMSDGVIFVVYHERESGNVYDLTDLS